MATNRATRYPGRWGAVSADYPMGVPKNRTSDTAKDGSYFEKDWIADYEAYFGAVLDEAGETVNGTTDTAQSSQLHKAMQKAREVSPLNNDWNGYLDPVHQSRLPAQNGYPGNSGGGEVAYTADEEISHGIYAGASGATVSSDDDGWIFTGSIYKLFTLTAEQLALIDVTTVPIFLKDQDGAAYFVNHNGTTINVTKPDTTTLKVEITSGIFAGLSITKLWRFFVTEKVGYVGELSVDGMLSKFPIGEGQQLKDVLSSRSAGVLYTNDTGRTIVAYISITIGSSNGSTLVNGLPVYVNSLTSGMTQVLIIPDGGTYIFPSGTGSSITAWHELRG